MAHAGALPRACPQCMSRPGLALRAENYAVDIGAPFRALLPVLAFEGATKRNRPHLQVCGCSCRSRCRAAVVKGCCLFFHAPTTCPLGLQVGDLVYCRVESAHRDLEPVLSCMDAAGKVRGACRT